MRFQGLLTRSVRGVWITSYSFGLRLFDQYLLRMVSQSPLNAVVLADRDKLAEVWDNLPRNDEYLARQAGSRYLLRGVRSAGGGAFHPKTYLFARSDGATLVVGSGNLTREGIDHGHEVFTSFRSEREADLPSMRAWAEWMSRLVENEADPLLRERWAALRQSSTWMPGPSDGASFLANDRQPMIDQLVAALPDEVSELHVTAPFFDRDATALKELLGKRPQARLDLYLGAGVNVDGRALAAVLGKAGELRLWRYAPRSFVHAKMIGAIGPDNEGVLLLGSPNLSRAALLGTCTEPGGGNWETAVLRRGSGEQVRAAFQGGAKLTLAELSLAEIESLDFEESEPAESGLLALRSASWREDGRIALRCDAAADVPSDTILSWSDGAHSAPLDDELVSLKPLDRSSKPPFLVGLAAPDGTPLTNRVPVDDPEALHSMLHGSQGQKDARPIELQGIEEAPLIQIALWANEKFIFDLDSTSAFRRVEQAIERPEAESDFWERYAREELQYDPRSQSYQPLTPGASDRGPVDELLRELQAMLHAAPRGSGPTLRILRGAKGEEDGEAGAGAPWTMEARQRRRAYNLFMRWCSAVGDPRHMLVSPQAPVVNYETLLGVLFAAWAHDALELERLRKLLLTLLAGFIGSGEGQGFLGRVTEDERVAALQRLDPFAMELAAGLAASAMTSHWRGDVYEWQPLLHRGLELDVLLLGDWSARVLERLTGKTSNGERIRELLAERIRFVDDDTWCERVAQELGLERVRLDLHRSAKVRSWVFAQGAGDPLFDTRLLILARRFLEFKKVPAVAVSSGEDAVMIFEPGERARAMVNGQTHSSSEPIGIERLEQIERQGGSWADLLGVLRSADAA